MEARKLIVESFLWELIVLPSDSFSITQYKNPSKAAAENLQRFSRLTCSQKVQIGMNLLTS
jgi:hypothetical protein